MAVTLCRFGQNSTPGLLTEKGRDPNPTMVDHLSPKGSASNERILVHDRNDVLFLVVSVGSNGGSTRDIIDVGYAWTSPFIRNEPLGSESPVWPARQNNKIRRKDMVRPCNGVITLGEQ